MFYNAKEEDLKISTGNVHYITFGKGNKPLVMIPGLRLSNIEGGARPVAWFYRMFAKDYKVYMFDRKDNIKDPVTIHDLAEDTADAMKALGIENAYIFGASQGGSIAQDLAIHHPELVKKMVLGVTLSRPNPTVEKSINLWIDMAKNKGLGAVAEDYTYRGFSESYLKKNKMFIPLSLKMQKFMDKDRFIALARAVLTVDTYDKLDEIKCPVLVLAGGQDKIASRAASVEIAEKLGCDHYIYEELGHEAYSESGDFNRRIYEFFEKENVKPVLVKNKNNAEKATPIEFWKKNALASFKYAEGKQQRVFLGPMISIFGFEDAGDEQKEAARLICDYVRGFKAKALLGLDDVYRECYYTWDTYRYRSEPWGYSLVCKNIVSTCEDTEDKRRLLILCTIDSDGYVRQDGVNYLSELKGSLPFLLLRLNDWVDEIKDAAYLASKKRINEADLEELVYSLPVLDKVKNSYRRREEVILEISESIGEKIIEKNNEFDYSSFKDYEQFAKNAFYKFLYNNNSYSKQQLLNMLSLTTGKYDSMMIISTIIHHFGITEEDFLKYKASGNTFIRKLAIKRWISDYGLWDGAEESLMDKSAGIRNLIQFYLRKENFDITRFYLDHLQSDDKRVAIKGLGETSGKEIVDHLIPFLDSDNVITVRTTLASIGRILKEEGTEYYLRFLNSDNMLLVYEACQQSLKWGVYHGEKILRDRYLKTDDDRKGFYYLLLMFKEPFWRSLPFYLSIYGRIPGKHQIILEKAINKRPMYSRISNDLKAEILAAIENNKKYLPESLINDIKFDMEHL